MKVQTFAITSLLLLAACGPQYSPDADALLKNPLYAEWHAEDIIEKMVDLEIFQDPIVQDEEKNQIISATKEKWIAIARDARTAQNEGMKGLFISAGSFMVGEVLYSNGVVYVGPDFYAAPGVELHVFLTTVVDPREVEFPDATAIDLGEMKVNQGPQSFIVKTPVEDPQLMRTVVLWDSALERLQGFAQLSPSF